MAKTKKKTTDILNTIKERLKKFKIFERSGCEFWSIFLWGLACQKVTSTTVSKGLENLKR